MLRLPLQQKENGDVPIHAVRAAPQMPLTCRGDRAALVIAAQREATGVNPSSEEARMDRLFTRIATMLSGATGQPKCGQRGGKDGTSGETVNSLLRR